MASLPLPLPPPSRLHITRKPTTHRRLYRHHRHHRGNRDDENETETGRTKSWPPPSTGRTTSSESTRSRARSWPACAPWGPPYCTTSTPRRWMQGSPVPSRQPAAGMAAAAAAIVRRPIPAKEGQHRTAAARASSTSTSSSTTRTQAPKTCADTGPSWGISFTPLCMPPHRTATQPPAPPLTTEAAAAEPPPAGRLARFRFFLRGGRSTSRLPATSRSAGASQSRRRGTGFPWLTGSGFPRSGSRAT